MAAFVVFDSNTGAILRTGTCAEGMVSAQAFMGVGEVSIEAVADMSTDYVQDIGNGPEVLTRPMPPELLEGPDGTWTALGGPEGMAIEVHDADLRTILATVPATGGTATVTLPDPGTYRLVVTAPFPSRPRVLEVVVT